MSINKLRFWCQKVLPLVYDESLSYYEVLNKMRYKINEIITGLDIYQIKFADPIYWDITKQYEPYTIVKDEDGGSYISKQPVPAGIALTNQEYWQNIGETQVFDQFVVNVADYGVLGVEGADYSTQLTEALTHGNVFYFPSGTYSFKNVEISKPVMFFGEGDETVFKPLHRISTSNQYETMILSTDNFIISNVKIVGDNSITEQSGERYYQKAIIQQYGGKFRMTECTVDQIFDTWHLSQGDLAFPDRNGLLLYVNNSDSCEIDHCKFKQYGGEEFIWVSRSRGRFGESARFLCHDNLFTDKLMLDNGGNIDGGSAINALGGNVSFYNNLAQNYYERGSFVNLLGNNVDIHSNVIVRSNMANVFETCEGYHCKNNSARIYNNYQEDINGFCDKTVKTMARNTEIYNNHFEGKNVLDSYALLDPNHVTVSVYKADDVSWTDYDNYIVRDNELVITGDAPSVTTSGAIRINQNNQASGSRSVIKNTVISGNKMSYTDAVTAFYNLIFSFASHKSITIENNYFPYIGTLAPSSSKLGVASFYEPQKEGDTVYFNDNVIFDALNGYMQCLSFVTGSNDIVKILAKGNVANSTGSFKVIASQIIANYIGNYNLNFTAEQG